MFKQGDRVILISQEGSAWLRNVPLGTVGEVEKTWFSYSLNKQQAKVVFLDKQGKETIFDVHMDGRYLSRYPQTVRLATEEEWLAHDVKMLRKQVKELNKVKLPMIERLKVLQAERGAK